MWSDHAVPPATSARGATQPQGEQQQEQEQEEEEETKRVHSWFLPQVPTGFPPQSPTIVTVAG